MDNMQKKKFHITPHSSKDYEAIKHLSKLSGSSISEIGAVALHEWLEDNFIKEIRKNIAELEAMRTAIREAK